MKNISLKAIIRPALTLFFICVAVTSLLALTNSFTDKKIAEREEQQIAETRKAVLPDAVSFEEVRENAFAGKTAGGDTAGYVITVTERGYGGDMLVMVGIDTEGKVSGVSLLRHNETPGLGAEAGKPRFLNQFTGKSRKVEVGGNIDSVSGATISSKAVAKAVNDAMEIYKAITEGEDG